MDENRRSFLKKAGGAAIGIGCGFPLLSVGCSSKHASGHGASSGSQLAMVVDIKKCRQEQVMQACIEACHLAHNVPDIPDPEEEIKWIWPEAHEDVFPDQTHAHMEQSARQAPVLVLCNHCESPSCVKVCPTKATWKRESDGLVMMDMHRCIGCRYCMAACPYGSRSFNWRDPRDHIARNEQDELPTDYPTRAIGVVEKCTFCADRLRDGREPACVEAANSVAGGRGALTFGDLSDPDSEVSRILREEHTICRRVALGTGPNVFYIV